jgi:hypothetical protein
VISISTYAFGLVVFVSVIIPISIALDRESQATWLTILKTDRSTIYDLKHKIHERFYEFHGLETSEE